MNTQKTVIFLQKPLYPSFTQLLIKFSQMNFLRGQSYIESSILISIYSNVE